MTQRSPLLGVLAALFILTACHATPLHIDEFRLSGSTTPTSADYWAAETRSDLQIQSGMRVAIVEFCVEFVTEKLKAPFARQPVARPDQVLPLGSLISLVGIGCERIDVDGATLDHVTEDLYAHFCGLLRERGLTVLDRRRVVDAPAYAALRRNARDDAARSLLWQGDTGRVRDVSLTSMPPLSAIEDNAFEDAAALELAQVALLAQTGADVALRVRWRVGIDEGYPSFEAGSLLAAVGRDGTDTLLRSRRALLASRLAVVDQEFELFDGQVVSLDGQRLHAGLHEVLEPYVTLAFSTLTPVTR